MEALTLVMDAKQINFAILAKLFIQEKMMAKFTVYNCRVTFSGTFVQKGLTVSHFAVDPG